MEKNCRNCLHCGKDTRFEPCKSCDGLWSNFFPKQPAREPQCKTRADLFRELARVIEMCAGNESHAVMCIKHGGDFELPDPFLIGNPEYYEFAIAIIEGHPIFAGTEFYKDGKKFTMSNRDRGLSFEGCTLSPPKPATITINGVEVKAPKSATVIGAGHVLTFGSYAVVSYFDCHDDALAMKAAFEGKK